VYGFIFSEWTVLKYWLVVETSFHPPSSVIFHNDTSGNSTHKHHSTSIMTTGAGKIADDGHSQHTTFNKKKGGREYMHDF
jgi:hypothetical protein